MDHTKEKNWILLFLTNANANLNIKNMKNSALVTKKEFNNFYGYTYTNRAIFAFSKSVNLNTLIFLNKLICILYYFA